MKHRQPHFKVRCPRGQFQLFGGPSDSVDVLDGLSKTHVS